MSYIEIDQFRHICVYLPWRSIKNLDHIWPNGINQILLQNTASLCYPYLLAWKHRGPYLSSLFKSSPIVEPEFLIPASRAVYTFWYLAMCSCRSTSQERLCEYFCFYYNRLKGYKFFSWKRKKTWTIHLLYWHFRLNYSLSAELLQISSLQMQFRFMTALNFSSNN